MQYRPFKKQVIVAQTPMQRFRDFQEARFLFSLGYSFSLVSRRFGYAVANEAYETRPLRKVSHMQCEHESCNSINASLRGGLYVLCDDCYKAFYTD